MFIKLLWSESTRASRSRSYSKDIVYKKGFKISNLLPRFSILFHLISYILGLSNSENNGNRRKYQLSIHTHQFSIKIHDTFRQVYSWRISSSKVSWDSFNCKLFVSGSEISHSFPAWQRYFSSCKEKEKIPLHRTVPYRQKLWTNILTHNRFKTRRYNQFEF